MMAMKSDVDHDDRILRGEEEKKTKSLPNGSSLLMRHRQKKRLCCRLMGWPFITLTLIIGFALISVATYRLYFIKDYFLCSCVGTAFNPQLLTCDIIPGHDIICFKPMMTCNLTCDGMRPKYPDIAEIDHTCVDGVVTTASEAEQVCVGAWNSPPLYMFNPCAWDGGAHPDTNHGVDYYILDSGRHYLCPAWKQLGPKAFPLLDQKEHLAVLAFGIIFILMSCLTCLVHCFARCKGRSIYISHFNGKGWGHSGYMPASTSDHHPHKGAPGQEFTLSTLSDDEEEDVDVYPFNSVQQERLKSRPSSSTTAVAAGTTTTTMIQPPKSYPKIQHHNDLAEVLPETLHTNHHGVEIQPLVTVEMEAITTITTTGTSDNTLTDSS